MYILSRRTGLSIFVFTLSKQLGQKRIHFKLNERCMYVKQAPTYGGGGGGSFKQLCDLDALVRLANGFIEVLAALKVHC